MTEYVVRFLVGGVMVSAFAMLGDVLRPKNFAALFGAAPSVALATLGIAVYRHGSGYAAQQTWAMTVGAIALAVYSVTVKCPHPPDIGERLNPRRIFRVLVVRFDPICHAEHKGKPLRLGVSPARQPHRSGCRKINEA
jgi:hypothetical protein